MQISPEKQYIELFHQEVVRCISFMYKAHMSVCLSKEVDIQLLLKNARIEMIDYGIKKFCWSASYSGDLFDLIVQRLLLPNSGKE